MGLTIHCLSLVNDVPTDNIHSSAKVMTTEVQDFNMVDSKLPASVKIEPEVDVEYPGQDRSESDITTKKTLICSQNVPSLPMQGYSQIGKMIYDDLDFKFVKQELSEEDKNHRFGNLVDMTNCRGGHVMTGHSNTESRMTKNNYEASQEPENCSQFSENVSSLFGIDTDKICLLQNNVEIKTGDKPYMSDVYDAATSVDKYLIRHKRKYTGKKPFDCGFCGASFTSADSLKCHKRIHTGEKPYKCDDCGASFTQVGSLKMHKRTHTGERPYKCDDCSSSFAQVGSLKTHKRTHTGERPYKCDYCDASFTVADKVKKHRRTHTGEKPYKCDSCCALFTEAGHLKRHRRIHIGDRPYKCDDCDASFNKAGCLQKHKNCQHSGE